jgi:hypothetical protein
MTTVIAVDWKVGDNGLSRWDSNCYHLINDYDYIVTAGSMRASRCCGRPVLQFHGAGSTIARAQPPPKHMHCRHYRPTTVPNTSQNGRPTPQSEPNSSTLSLQGVVFKVEGTKVTLCHRRQSSPYRNFPELSLSSTSVLNCT